MIAYTVLAFEIMIRFWLNKPLRGKLTRLSSASNSSVDEDSKSAYLGFPNNGAYNPNRVMLMVIGLAITTVLVFIRSAFIFLPSQHKFNGYLQIFLSYRRIGWWLGWPYYSYSDLFWLAWCNSYLPVAVHPQHLLPFYSSQTQTCRRIPPLPPSQIRDQPSQCLTSIWSGGWLYRPFCS